MAEVRILLRWCVLITVGLVFVTCKGTGGVDGDRGTRAANPCMTKAEGDTNREAPIICVDDTGATLSVSPDSITVHSVRRNDRQPVPIHWWTRSGGNALSLKFGPDCVTEPDCKTNGHCKAFVRPSTTLKPCKYSVDTDKHEELDPEIIIDPCCPAP